jgi:DNA mismatch endonuclease (patch repair protein)
VAEALKRKGFKVSLNPDHLPGKPDLVLDRHRVAVFVHGCFWHGCPRHFRCPKHNARWWREKIEVNRKRDKRKARALRRMGYSVITVWEHEDCSQSASRVQKAVARRRQSNDD